MKQQYTILPCGFHEEALIASALDEADTTLQHAVHAHIHQCQVCYGLFDTYQGLQQVFTALQDTSAIEPSLHLAREKLAQRFVPTPVVQLAYRYFTSTVGELCIATSPQGVPLVAWQTHAAPLLAALTAREGVEVQEDGSALQALIAELQGYLAGTRERLDWPVDTQLVHSPFQRQVLQVTASIPYGAVMSYQGVAEAIGQPKAVRAVAQALRRNPLAIVIPCHRVVGRTGHLTGYAGGLERKQALLAHEGVPLQRRPAGVFIDRERMYIGWRTERCYCRPHCPSLTAIMPSNTLFLSPRVVAIQAEFAPCAVCHPEAA